jgi:outer membrane receptor for ferrienterochelin and colicins
MRQNLYLILCSGLAFGADSLAVDGDLGTTVVTGSRMEESSELASERITVVSRAQIEAMNAHNVAEVVSHLPGVNVSVHPATSAFAEVGMQGLGGAGLKVLVDGIEMTGDDGGNNPIASIPIGDVERIEILPGAASALYGSDAMGGVINVITRVKMSRAGLRLRARGGSGTDGRRAGDAQVAKALGSFLLRASTSWDWDRGSRHDTTNAFGVPLAIFPMPRQELVAGRLSADFTRKQLKLGSSFGVRHQVRTIRDVTLFESNYEETGLDASLHGQAPLTSKSDLAGEVYVQSFDRTLQQKNLTFGNELPAQKSSYLDAGADLRLSLRLDSWNLPLFGISNRIETLQSPDFESRRDDRIVDVFSQDVISLWGDERYQLVPGIRYSGIFTPKLSMRISPSPTWILRASYGMGYRRPTLKQRYWVFFHQAPYNFLLRGNPDLLPERSHSLNASADWKIRPTFKVWGSIFGNAVRDLIQDTVIDPTPGSALDVHGIQHSYLHVRSYANIGKAYTTGGSLGMEWNNALWNSALAYSRLVAKQSTSAGLFDLPLQTPHSLRASLARNFPQPDISLRLEVDYNSRELSSAEPRLHTPDFLMVNASVRKTIHKHYSLLASVDNALDNLNVQKGDPAIGLVSQEDWYGLHDGRIWRLEFTANY